MRFFIDQDVYQITADILKDLGHDVTQARDIGYSKAIDLQILRWAYQNRRILITRDKDFGALTFVNRCKNAGIIFLRVIPSNIDIVHTELIIFLRNHGDMDFNNTFSVIEPGRHRIRRLC